MKTRIQSILSGGTVIFLLIGFNWVGVRAADPGGEPKTSHAIKPRSAVQLKTAMRTLWEEHITYTRNYIISTLGDLPDADAVASRLLRNQDEIGDAIKPYYGDEAGGKLAGLLRSHILIAAEVVKAAKADNKQKLTEKQKEWSANGKDLASFLAGANPG